MRSTYKRLGSYIRELKAKNSDGSCSDLRGVSIGKEFMPSVANVHGTDLSKYKQVNKHQFAFNPMHVGRDEVLPIALLAENGPIIVSPAYVVFEVCDHKELLPEYLMMWCRRPEFDRNAWFTTDNSVRGGFSWHNFCAMELPIPHIDKQREIVKEYQTVVDRIRLNDRLNEKLEEAAQAVYRQWFEEFDFPMTNEYAESIGKKELAGRPYKSNGGEMEYNEALEQKIPKGWKDTTLGELIEIKHGYAFEGEFFTREETDDVLLSPGNFRIGGGFNTEGLRYFKGPVPSAYIFDPGDMMVTMTDLSKQTDTLGFPARIPRMGNKNLLHNQRLGKVVVKDSGLEPAIYRLMCSTAYRKHVIAGATGTTVKHTSPTRIAQFCTAFPSNRNAVGRVCESLEKFANSIEVRVLENFELEKLRSLILSRMVLRL